jgi:hypothetical protein
VPKAVVVFLGIFPALINLLFSSACQGAVLSRILKRLNLPVSDLLSDGLYFVRRWWFTFFSAALQARSSCKQADQRCFDYEFSHDLILIFA